ncbi:MAG: hypothetical protein CM15mP22_0410 [Gammaproteobacteria bacterium]|nr:MAG: hypothetical protein CM15mP22_0410 [Gammaproteobacteria bacterium]
MYYHYHLTKYILNNKFFSVHQSPCNYRKKRLCFFFLSKIIDGSDADSPKGNQLSLGMPTFPLLVFYITILYPYLILNHHMKVFFINSELNLLLMLKLLNFLPNIFKII